MGFHGVGLKVDVALKVDGESAGISVKSLAKVKNTMDYKRKVMHQFKSKDPLHLQSTCFFCFFFLVCFNFFFFL